MGIFNPQKWTFEGSLVLLKLGQNPFLLDMGISSRVRKFEGYYSPTEVGNTNSVKWVVSTLSSAKTTHACQHFTFLAGDEQTTRISVDPQPAVDLSIFGGWNARVMTNKNCHNQWLGVGDGNSIMMQPTTRLGWKNMSLVNWRSVPDNLGL